jgi:4-carboxymuconolactone decarboxylase
MSRIAIPTGEEMTPAQAEVVQEVLAGRRNAVPAPVYAWMRNPEFARRAQRLGELLRFETSLAPHESELAILICGAHWMSHYEWSVHKPIALAAGLDPRTVADLAEKREPYLRDERERAIYRVASTLLTTRRVPESLYRESLRTLSERGLVELVGILGYYSLISLTLNAFELGLPEHAAPELNDPDFPATARPSAAQP